MASSSRTACLAIFVMAALNISANCAQAGDMRLLAYARVDNFLSEARDFQFEPEPAADGCIVTPGDDMECFDGE
jgi:hypothetical protein